MSQIPLDNHPHVLDSILAAAPYESLRVLRATSRVLRDRIDKMMVYHIELDVDANTRMYGGGLIPREGWIYDPELADAVRIVDLHFPSPVYDVTPPPSPPPRPLWPEDWDAECAEPYIVYDCPCQAGGVEDHYKVREFGSRLRHVKLLRRWGLHTCPSPVSAPREVTFTPPEMSRRHRAAVTVQVAAKTSVLRVTRVNDQWTGITVSLDHKSEPDLLIYRVWPQPETKPPKQGDWDPDGLDPTPYRAYMKLVDQLSTVLMHGVPVTFVGLDKLDLDPGDVWPERTELVLERFRRDLQMAAGEYPDNYESSYRIGIGKMIKFMTVEEYEASTDPEIIDLEEFDGDWINDPNGRG